MNIFVVLYLGSSKWVNTRKESKAFKSFLLYLKCVFPQAWVKDTKRNIEPQNWHLLSVDFKLQIKTFL